MNQIFLWRTEQHINRGECSEDEGPVVSTISCQFTRSTSADIFQDTKAVLSSTAIGGRVLVTACHGYWLRLERWRSQPAILASLLALRADSRPRPRHVRVEDKNKVIKDGLVHICIFREKGIYKRQ